MCDPQRPSLTATQAVALASEHWSVHVQRVEQLPSYDDQNFWLLPEADDGQLCLSKEQARSHTSHTWRGGAGGLSHCFLLKATNTRDSAQAGYLEVRAGLARQPPRSLPCRPTQLTPCYCRPRQRCCFASTTVACPWRCRWPLPTATTPAKWFCGTRRWRKAEASRARYAS